MTPADDPGDPPADEARPERVRVRNISTHMTIVYPAGLGGQKALESGEEYQGEFTAGQLASMHEQTTVFHFLEPLDEDGNPTGPADAAPRGEPTEQQQQDLGALAGTAAEANTGVPVDQGDVGEFKPDIGSEPSGVTIPPADADTVAAAEGKAPTGGAPSTEAGGSPSNAGSAPATAPASSSSPSASGDPDAEKFDHDKDGQIGGMKPAGERGLEALWAEAEAAGVTVNKSWGEGRLRKEIAKAKGKG